MRVWLQTIASVEGLSSLYSQNILAGDVLQWHEFAIRWLAPVHMILVELLEIRRHRVVLVCFARFAPAPYPIVLADAPPSALLARAPLPSVLADAPPSALLALAPLPSVLADARPSALLALAPLPIVLAFPWL